MKYKVNKYVTCSDTEFSKEVTWVYWTNPKTGNTVLMPHRGRITDKTLHKVTDAFRQELPKWVLERMYWVEKVTGLDIS